MNNEALAEETWDELVKRIGTPEERAANKLWIAFATELIEARDKGISKKNLAKLKRRKKVMFPAWKQTT